LAFGVDHLRTAEAERSAAHDAPAITRQQSCRFLGRAVARSACREVRKPWQDRRMLNKHRSFAAVMTASRRLAFGFRTFAKTMRDNRNVQYSSCAT
jgi:hypothetical protein